MHHLVEGVGDEAAPGMADPGRLQLGKSRTISLRSSGPLTRGRSRNATRARRRRRAGRRVRAVVVDDLAAVAGDATRREDAPDRLGRQFLGGDDVAADRDDPALQPGCQALRVAIGGHDNIARCHDTAAGGDAEAGAVALDAGRLGVRHDGGAGRQHAIQYALMQAAGVDRGVLGEHGTAEVGVGAKLAALLGAGTRRIGTSSPFICGSRDLATRASYWAGLWAAWKRPTTRKSQSIFSRATSSAAQASELWPSRRTWKARSGPWRLASAA